MRRILKDQSLTVVLFATFAILLFLQSLTGWHAYNADQVEHRESSIGYGAYLTTGHFVEATFENWESEFLQMGAYILLTVFLVAKGSGESKSPEGDEALDADPREEADRPDAPHPVRVGGWRLALYENSLGLAFGLLFVLSIVGHALGGARVYSTEQIAHGASAVGVWRYVTTSTFWFESFQNWQSEFLAMFSIVALSIFLRQRGSPESKPVAASHAQTGG